VLRVPRPDRIGHKDLDLLANQLGSCVPEKFLDLTVHETDSSLAVDHHEGVGRGLEQGLEEPVALLRAHLVGDVPDRRRHQRTVAGLDG